MKWLNLLLTLVFILYSDFINAQTVYIDSIKSKLIVADNSQKLNLLIHLCEQYNSLSSDTLLSYLEKGLKLATRNTKEFYRLEGFYSQYLLKLSKAKEAVHYLDSIQKVREGKATDKNVQSEHLFFNVRCLIRNNQIKQAIDSTFSLLKISEREGDSLTVMRCYSLLGLGNMELENEKEAIQWLNKGITYTSNPTLHTKVNALFLNIASCYRVLGQFDTALAYINKALQLAKGAQDLTHIANALNIRAAILFNQKQTQMAKSDLEEALSIRRKVGDLHFIVADLGVLSSFYTYSNEPLKGIAYANEGIQLAMNTNNTYKLIYLYKCLANAYERSKQPAKAYEVALTVIKLKDSLYESNTEKEISEIQSKYEMQKKENIIIQQNYSIMKSRNFNIATLIVLGLGSVIVWLVYRNYTHRQKIKLQHVIAEEKAIAMQAIRDAEEKERKRIAADLHDNLGSFAAAITSNINYLRDTISDKESHIVGQLEENAQAIVTQLGDSIWILKNEYLPLTKLADRFKIWVQRLMQNYPDVVYNYTEDIENDIELSPHKILNVFLILKECVNNSLKHSDCNELSIDFNSNPTILISISDNGKGFQHNLINDGNGIENIKYRAKDCGLHIKWDNVQPKGTIVTIRQVL